jgi:hypothetical protein
MYINKEEVLKILSVMEKFPDTSSFVLESDSSSGIGSTITLTVQTTINEIDGEFMVEISGVENW